MVQLPSQYHLGSPFTLERNNAENVLIVFNEGNRLWHKLCQIYIHCMHWDKNRTRLNRNETAKDILL